MDDQVKQADEVSRDGYQPLSLTLTGFKGIRSGLGRDTITLDLEAPHREDGEVDHALLLGAVGLELAHALEEAGIIAGYYAQLDEKATGFEVIAFAMVTLHSQSEQDLRAFENRVIAWPLVRECYMLSGETDFILKCVAPDLSSFQRFLTEELTAAENVGSVKTSLVIRCAKDDPGVPFDVLEARLARMG